MPPTAEWSAVSPSSRARRAARPGRARRPKPRQRSSFGALALAVLGVLLPGTAYLAARRFRLGCLVTTISLALYGAAAYVGLKRRDDVIAWALDPDLLLWMVAGLGAVALCWVVVLVTSYKMLRPLAVGPASRLFGAVVIGLVCFAMASSTALGAQTLMAQRSLVRKVFGNDKSKSQTRPTITNTKDVWAQLPRLNLLLLGADDGEGRDGTRTDTVMVASIDTKTGDTALISLTRNWMRMPFPKDSPLYKIYPTGFWDPNGPKEQSDFYLDAMYRKVPELHRGILGPSDNEGADVLKLSVGEALGLQLHYYVQINLAGFEQMVEALGGITVNINYPVPVGGNDDKKIPPSRYLEPGPNRKLNGTDALWFARGRYRVPGADVARQARQRCTIKAIVERATPQNVLANYQSIAKAGEQLIRTDVPPDILPHLITLGQKVKSAKITNIDLDKKRNYPNGRNPNYAAMRILIANALNPPTPRPNPSPTTTPTRRPTTTKPTANPTTPTNLTEACAYTPGPPN
ncbi:LytR family transcriptional attenuator [Kribbella steppae]|uniref:LytR family transcriptional attenuator n=1 Tax=Kribbella steppae TaxID=2512223 RepID=A0A4R2HAK6_9ACTN|nr:LCP family protein [Kribbella steppae]TCO24587.1 LytR family transcriptional attenuator [Kribbella steppae]